MKDKKRYRCDTCENVDWDGNCKITRRYVRGWFGLDKVPASYPMKYKEKVDEK